MEYSGESENGFKTIEVLIITIFVIFLILAIMSYFYSWFYGRNLKKRVTTRGMNGLGGSTINLQCPPGQVISFTNNNPTTTRGALICTGDSSCDAFWNPQTGQATAFFAGVDLSGSPAYIDTMTNSQFSDIQGCQGQQSCQWVVPISSDSRLQGTCLSSCSGNIAMVGTYDCVPR